MGGQWPPFLPECSLVSPRLILPSVSPLSKLSFNYSAENRPGPADLVKYSFKIVISFNYSTKIAWAQQIW
jgi:hypothetical protein